MTDNPERSTDEYTHVTYLSDAMSDFHGNPVLDPLLASAERSDEADVGGALAAAHHQAHLQQRPSQYLVCHRYSRGLVVKKGNGHRLESLGV